MPVEGYIRGKPDHNWWLEQIKAGEEFRRKFAYESDWDKWRAFYRGNWAPGIMPLNLFYTFMRTTVPRVYFRDPSVSVSPAKPGLLNLTFARILERVDNKMLRRMRFKQEMKRTVQDAFMFGTGIPKIGFGGFYSPTILDDEPGAPLVNGQNQVEFMSNVEPFMPWVSRVAPGNFVVPAGTMSFNQVRWVAEKIVRPLDDVQRDTRFENTRGLKSFEHGNPSNDIAIGVIQRPVKMVELWEIRDKATGKVFVIAPDHGEENKAIFFDNDRNLMQFGNFPYFPFIFNEDDEAFWGLPDAKILEPYQLEVNEIKTQIMKHRRMTLIKLLVKKKSMTVQEAEKLVSEDVAAVAWVEGQGAISASVEQIKVTGIPQDLFTAADVVVQDVRESLGFSRNQFGEFNSRSGDTTATEANIVKMATEIRVDERRDALADTVVDFVEMMHGILFDNWGDEQIIDVIGPGGVPVWVRVRGELLKRGRFSVKVDPDSSIPETRAVREQRAVGLFQLLQTNPLIDPIKLTQYLLHEMKGVQFDDMMKMLPGPGNIPDRPIEVEDFSGLVANSVQQAQQAALPPPASSGK